MYASFADQVFDFCKQNQTADINPHRQNDVRTNSASTSNHSCEHAWCQQPPLRTRSVSAKAVANTPGVRNHRCEHARCQQRQLRTRFVSADTVANTLGAIKCSCEHAWCPQPPVRTRSMPAKAVANMLRVSRHRCEHAWCQQRQLRTRPCAVVTITATWAHPGPGEPSPDDTEAVKRSSHGRRRLAEASHGR